MSSDFTVIEPVRQVFGHGDHHADSDWLPGELSILGGNPGYFVGPEKDFTFDCPEVDVTEHAVLQFQVAGVSGWSVFKINDRDVQGGLQGGPTDESIEINGKGIAMWTAHVMLVQPNVLRSTGNVLHIAAAGSDYSDWRDHFVIDNIVVFYKLQKPVTDDGRDRPEIGDVQS